MILFWHRIYHELPVLQLDKQIPVVLEYQRDLVLGFLDVEELLTLYPVILGHFAFGKGGRL